MVSGFDVRRGSMIILERLTAVFEWLGTRLKKDAGEVLDNAFGLLRAQWYFSSLAHFGSSYRVQSSTWTRLFASWNLELGNLHLVGLNRRTSPFGFFV